MAAPSAIVFDLDGTLIESRHDLAEAVNRTRCDLGLEPIGVDSITRMVGDGARMLLRRALRDEIDREAFEEAFRGFLVHYDDVCLLTTRTYDGIDELLDRLEARVPLALLTNKPASATRKILEGLSIDGRFGEVLAGDTAPARKPDPAGLRWIAGRFGLRVDEVMMVGDSPTDAATAAAAGARLALVEWGFSAPEVLHRHAAEIRARDVGELASRLLPPASGA